MTNSLENLLQPSASIEYYRFILNIETLIKNHMNTSKHHSSIIKFIFNELQHGDIKIKKFLFRRIKSLQNAVLNIPEKIDIVRMLSSVNFEMRDFGVELVDEYFNYYQNDDLVVYLIKDNEKFYSRLVNSPKYHKLFPVNFNEEDLVADTEQKKTVKKTLIENISTESKDHEDIFSKICSMSELLNYLRKNKPSDSNVRIIYDYFCNLIEKDTQNYSFQIQDIDDTLSEKIFVDIECEFLLDLYSLKYSPLFQTINDKYFSLK